MGLVERVRAAAASYWTIGAAWAVMSALHWRWLWRSTHAGDVLSAYGAGLVVLGLLVAARPFIRAGVRRMAEQQAIPPQSPIWPEGAWAKYEAKVLAAVPDVWAERVVAVGVVVIGTFLNGWGTPLARRWGLPV
jgi:hypothetical protein